MYGLSHILGCPNVSGSRHHLCLKRIVTRGQQKVIVTNDLHVELLMGHVLFSTPVSISILFLLLFLSLHIRRSFLPSTSSFRSFAPLPFHFHIYSTSTSSRFLCTPFLVFQMRFPAILWAALLAIQLVLAAPLGPPVSTPSMYVFLFMLLSTATEQVSLQSSAGDKLGKP